MGFFTWSIRLAADEHSMRGHMTDFYLQKILWRAINFFKALLTSIGHRLHVEVGK
jgi:hypothetical protein